MYDRNCGNLKRETQIRGIGNTGRDQGKNTVISIFSLKNPNVSFCIYPKDFNPVLSLNGKVVFVDIEDVNALPGSEKFPAPDDPALKIFFYINVEEIQTFSNADGAKTYKV